MVSLWYKAGELGYRGIGELTSSLRPFWWGRSPHQIHLPDLVKRRSPNQTIIVVAGAVVVVVVVVVVAVVAPCGRGWGWIGAMVMAMVMTMVMAIVIVGFCFLLDIIVEHLRH